MSEVLDEDVAILPAKQSTKQAYPLTPDEFQTLTLLRKAISEESEIDLDKISAIKQEIAKGEYSISSQAIAKELLEVE